MSHFSETLKTLRQKADLSMQTLADKANVSKSMICKIENCDVQPTLDVASRLAKALGKTLSEMLHASQATQVIFQAVSDQASWEDGKGVKRRNISPIIEGLKTEWIEVELPPQTGIAKCQPLNTAGAEKFILVKQGTLELGVDDQSYTLNTGDSLYFDARLGHEFANKTDELVVYYVVIKHQ